MHTQLCERCKIEQVEDLNVEAWEETGLILCEGCVDEHFEDASGAADFTTGQPA